MNRILLQEMVLVSFAVTGGCTDSIGSVDLPDSGDAAADGSVVDPTDKVDVLFIVDDGSAGDAFKLEIARHAGELVYELIEPRVNPETGDAPTPVRSLHVALTSTSADMYGFQTGNCFEVEDGRLIEPDAHCGRGPGTDCANPPCPWLSYSETNPGQGESETMEDVSCLASSGQETFCGWDQPLQAVWQALSLRLADGEANEGFLQDDSVLALIFLSDGDDCSAADAALFDPEQFDVFGGYPASCVVHPEMLRAVDEYVRDMRSLRPMMADRVVVGVFGGLPPDSEWRPGEPIDVLRDFITVDPENPWLVQSVCEWNGGIGWPPARLVDFAYAFGDDGYIVSSFCGYDWDSTSAMMDIAVAIRGRMRGSTTK